MIGQKHIEIENGEILKGGLVIWNILYIRGISSFVDTIKGYNSDWSR